MKPGKSLVRAILILFFLVALAYFAAYAYHTFFASYDTATIYTYTGENVLPAQGILIREETVLDEGGALQEVVVAEGENVAANEVVARIYSSQQALENRRQLEKLSIELERLEYIRIHGSEAGDATRLNSEIVDAITGIQSDAARQDFTDLEDQVEELKDLVFRRDYTYSASSTLSDQIALVEEQIETLENATERAVSTVTSPAAGIFSAVVDGYESVFDLESLEALTPDTLREAMSSGSSVSGQPLGKVITDFTWYYGAIMDASVTKYLSSGSQVTVNFEGSAGAQEMTVSHISAADENGEVVVLFSSISNLSATTLLRLQDVDVVYQSVTGLRIPQKALRADQETGELGVYRLSGAQAEWIPVDLLFTGEDFYLVRSKASGEEQSQLEEAQALRAGNQVLVRGMNLTDGKVIE